MKHGDLCEILGISFRPFISVHSQLTLCHQASLGVIVLLGRTSLRHFFGGNKLLCLLRLPKWTIIFKSTLFHEHGLRRDAILQLADLNLFLTATSHLGTRLLWAPILLSHWCNSNRHSGNSSVLLLSIDRVTSKISTLTSRLCNFVAHIALDDGWGDLGDASFGEHHFLVAIWESFLLLRPT